MTKAIFIIINQSFRENMSPDELYEATRGEWTGISPKKQEAKYGLAVAYQQVREMYIIERWEQLENGRWKFFGKKASGEIRDKCVGLSTRSMPRSYGATTMLINLDEFMGNSEPSDLPSTNNESEKNMTNEHLNLLLQFYQIIFYGPPGTGKTYAAKGILRKLLGDNFAKLQNKRWDIVQFHPSYNYEDFVRGVQVKTENGQVAYETLNRTFGEMCERANEDSKNDYVLIIDEINRANVSAVLGELIYALEYRDEKIKTPYLGDIVIPSNLYIIGTMNTADRTIGQIDYAVRRRFAFLHCPPDETIIEDETAYEFFAAVDEIFHNHISQDFDAADVRIGHSYFLPKNENGFVAKELANKILYQVVPILWEYVKDGVLTKAAETKIKEIEEKAKKLLADESEESDSSVEYNDNENQNNGNRYFYWEKDGQRKYENFLGRTALAVITDFVNAEQEKNPSINAEDLANKLSSIAHGKHKRIESNISKKLLRGQGRKYFGDSPIKLINQETVYISNQWGLQPPMLEMWNKFKTEMAKHGYKIGQLVIFNVGEGESRSWKYCYRYNFLAAGGMKAYHTQMKNLKINDIVFANRAGETSQRGCIAYGRVISEAVDISEFITPKDGLLADCKTDEGISYREKNEKAFTREYPDYAVGIEWFAPSPIDSPVRLSRLARQGRTESIGQDNFDKLNRAFNLNNENTE